VHKNRIYLNTEIEKALTLVYYISIDKLSPTEVSSALQDSEFDEFIKGLTESAKYTGINLHLDENRRYHRFQKHNIRPENICGDEVYVLTDTINSFLRQMYAMIIRSGFNNKYSGKFSCELCVHFPTEGKGELKDSKIDVTVATETALLLAELNCTLSVHIG